MEVLFFVVFLRFHVVVLRYLVVILRYDKLEKLLKVPMESEILNFINK